jgi:hypothetical protein
MSTIITITYDDGGLLERNKQQTAANRHAFDVNRTAQEAAQGGVQGLRERRIAEGRDPLTGGRLQTLRSSSKLRRTDQEPAAFRRRGGFYVGVAWLEIIEDTEAGTGTIRIGSGDASQWAEESMVPYVQYEDVTTTLTDEEFEAYLDFVPRPPIDNFDTGPAIARTPIPIQHWFKQIESPTVDGDIIGLSLSWFASGKRIDVGSGSNSILEIDVLPAGEEAAYVVCTDERVSSFVWCSGFYYGWHYFDYAASNNLFTDGFYPIDTGSYYYRQRKVTTFYVTRTSVTKVVTPTWADSTYSTRKHGTYTGSSASGTFSNFRNPADHYYAEFGIFSIYPMPLTGPTDIFYPPVGAWTNEDPPGWSYTVGSFYTRAYPLPLEAGFPSFPETDIDSFPGGYLNYLRPYRGIFTPLQFFIGDNNYKGDASTPELRQAYGMPNYLYQADTTNYAPVESTAVLNGFALDPDVERTPQQVFDAAIAARFLVFKSSENPPKTSRSDFAAVGVAQINGEYASPLYFSDWAKPSFCTSSLQRLGFNQSPIV